MRCAQEKSALAAQLLGVAAAAGGLAGSLIAGGIVIFPILAAAGLASSLLGAKEALEKLAECIQEKDAEAAAKLREHAERCGEEAERLAQDSGGLATG
jgi:hypothetical protein